MQIYQNPEKVLLVTLFEKTGDEVSGVLVLERRILVVEGDTTKFAAAQKRDVSIIEKITRENHFKYLVVDSTPAYVPYSETDLSNEVSKQYEELDALFKLTKKGLESTGDVRAKELKNSTDDEAQNLLGDPIAILSFSKKGVLVREGREPGVQVSVKALLGLDREGQKAEVPLKSAFSTIIVGESREKRLHLMHILIEDMLLNSIPCVVFDADGAFAGLPIPSKNKEEFEKYGMRPQPIGFPFKQFDLGKSLFIDMTMIDADLFLPSFNLEKSDVAPLLKSIYDERKEKLSVLGDLITELNNFKETKEIPKFVILKAIRVVEVMQKSNPMLFGKNISEELVSPWKDGIGKVLYISLSKQREEVKRLVVNSVMRAVTSSPFSSTSVVLAFEPGSEVMREEIFKHISEFPKAGKGYIVQAEHDVDLNALSDSTLKLELVGNEVILSEKNEAKRRFNARPAYSACNEFSGVPIGK